MWQDSGSEGRLRHVKDLGGKGRTERGTLGKEGYGMGYRSPWWTHGAPGSGTSKVGLVLLELYHKVVNVDELSPCR